MEYYLDIETIGLNPQRDRIVEICITKILPNGNEETLNSEALANARGDYALENYRGLVTRYGEKERGR